MSHCSIQVLSQAKDVHQSLDSVAKGVSVALRNMCLEGKSLQGVCLTLISTISVIAVGLLFSYVFLPHFAGLVSFV